MQALSSPQLLLRRREVAQVLGISERTVQDMMKRGDLPVVRLANRTVRFPREAIVAFVEARTEISAPTR